MQVQKLKALLIGILFFVLQGCEENSFLNSHWKEPMGEQGPPPSHFSQLEKSLEPQSCGTCHKPQFEAWQNSLHSQTISPGVLWQLPGLGHEESQKCFRCHSPLAETKQYLSIEEGWKHTYPEEWNSYLPQGSHGLICASCHVRNQQRFGPPSLNGTIGTEKNLPHGGYTTALEFESSLFCKNCHESSESGKKINGKRMMETYSEWKESDFAKQGIQCQNCHMPDRKHEWKGIHDLEMVKQGLSFSFQVKEEGNYILIRGSFTSEKIGHKFPSYAVPKVYVRFVLENGNRKEMLLREEVIGRFVDIFLEKEIYDNRLSPGETFSMEERIEKKDIDKDVWVRMEVDVDPGEMYVRMFRHNLENRTSLKLSEKSISILKQALAEKERSYYRLFTSKQRAPGSLPR